MYHQFDRSMHPRQSVFNLVMNMSEQNKQLEGDIKELEAVSMMKETCVLVTCSSDSHLWSVIMKFMRTSLLYGLAPARCSVELGSYCVILC